VAPAPAPAATELPAPKLPQPAQPAPAPKVRLRVGGVRGVEVLVDGVKLGTTPFDTRLPSRERARQVVLRGAHGSANHTIAGDADATLETPRAPARPASPPPRPAKPKSHGAPEIKDPFAN
jgi:hypothetical protein